MAWAGGVSPAELAGSPPRALLVAGFVTGRLAGLLGIGGGGILVPVLYELFGSLGVDEAVRMHLAVGTSLAVIVPTSLARSPATARRARSTWAACAAWRCRSWLASGSARCWRATPTRPC